MHFWENYVSIYALQGMHWNQQYDQEHLYTYILYYWDIVV